MGVEEAVILTLHLSRPIGACLIGRVMSLR